MEVIENKLKASLPEELQQKRTREIMEVTKEEIMYIKAIRSSKKFRSTDYVRLIPDIHVELRPVDQYEAGYVTGTKNEMFYGFSVNFFRYADMYDKGKEREAKKLDGESKISGIFYNIKNLVNKKYVYLSQEHRLNKIRETVKTDISKLIDIEDRLTRLYSDILDNENLIEKLKTEVRFFILEAQK